MNSAVYLGIVQGIRSSLHRGLNLKNVAFFCIAIGGAALLSPLYSQRAVERDRADRLLAMFDARSGLTEGEMRAVQELYTSDLETRAAFLHRALSGRNGAVRLNAHRHAISVAMSTVNRDDARFLFKREIVPALKQSNDPAVLRASFTLIQMWSIASAIGVRERSQLASVLRNRFVQERDPTLRNDLKLGMELFRDPKNVERDENPNSVSDPLVLRSEDVTDPGKLRAILAGRVRTEDDVRLLAASAYHLSTLAKDPSANLNEFTTIVTRRIAEQHGAYEISLLDGALAGLASHGVNSELATELVGLLVARIEREREIPDLVRVVAGLQILARYVPADAAPPLVSRLIDRMRPESSTTTLRAVAFAIGSLSNAAREDQIDRAASNLTTRISKANDPATMRTLLEGLLNLGDDLPERYLEAAADRVGLFISAGPNPEDLPDLVASLRALNRNTSEQMATIAEELVNRIRAERDPDTLRALGGLFQILPEGSLTAAQLQAMAHIFTIPEAPCSIAAQVGDEQQKVSSIARQIQNPFCSESSWKELAVVLGPPQVLLNKDDQDRDDENGEDSFHVLIVEDDDGESEMETELGIYPIDFNRLSKEIDPFRNAAVDPDTASVLPLFGVIFLVTGSVLLWVLRKETVH